MKVKTLVLLMAAMMTAGCAGKKDNIEQRVDELYARMTPGERVAQLHSFYMDMLFTPEGEIDSARCAELIPNGVGHLSQFCMEAPRDPNELRDRVAKLQHYLMHHTPNGIPALFHEEVLSGINTLGATIYPQQIGQAGSFDTERARIKTEQTATRLRSFGGVLALSPMVDVCRVPSFNRLEESYGEDGYLSAAMGCAFVEGLQRGDLKKGVGACSKHYLGYGGGGDEDEKAMMEEIITPHEAMIRTAGSKVLMPGYHAVRGTNCAANGWILKDILRDYIGFDGMVVSDYGAIEQIPGYEIGSETAAAALNGGTDVDFPAGVNYRHLPEAIADGSVSEESFEKAVKNVLRHKFRAGLMDKDAYLYSTGTITLDSPEERQTAYEIAVRSVVLLENRGVLPITKGSRVLVTGPNANTMWAMCGDYSYPAMQYFWKREDVGSENPHIVTLLEGMRDAGDNIRYTRGCDWTEVVETAYSETGDERAWQAMLQNRKVSHPETADEAEALRLAAEADIIVAAVGENVMLCGENRDRKDMRLDLPGRQQQFVERLIATGKPVVLVMFGGRALVVSEIADRCAAVIQAWYPGEEGGHAVADILYGKVSPSAKLSVSYPNQPVYEPLCYNRGIGQDSRVAWPFGYGLSYTSFEYANLKMAREAGTDAKDFEVSFEVKNTGDMAAEEVAQLYVSPAEGQPLRPIALQGFARVALEPGETKTVRMKVHVEQLGYFSHEGEVRQWNVAPGRYTLKIGASSQDIRLTGEITLSGEAYHKPIREYYFTTVE